MYFTTSLALCSQAPARSSQERFDSGGPGAAEERSQRFSSGRERSVKLIIITIR